MTEPSLSRVEFQHVGRRTNKEISCKGPASPSKGGAYCGDISDCEVRSRVEEDSSIVICFEGDEVAEGDDDVATCCICLEPYEQHNPPSHMRCGHHFHVPCLLGWQQRSMHCPLCQAPLDGVSASPTSRRFSPTIHPQSSVDRPSDQQRAPLSAEAMERIIRDLRVQQPPRVVDATDDATMPRVLLHLSIEAELRRQRRERRRRRNRDVRLRREGSELEQVDASAARVGTFERGPAEPGERIEMVEVTTEMNDSSQSPHRRSNRSRRLRPQNVMPVEEPRTVTPQRNPSTAAKKKPGLFDRLFGCCSSKSFVADVE